jgi:hypothetical protein
MSEYPKGLLDWAGHRAGGVRRLFHDASGRPAREVIETPLLARVREWARDLAVARTKTPRVVLLVGGPGNGKTEAVESAIVALDDSFSLAGELMSRLRREFTRVDGTPVPRLASAQLRPGGPSFQPSLVVVQDASVADPARPEMSPAELLVEDLETHALGATNTAYLACVNRGILDDAMILAVEKGRRDVIGLVEATIRAVGVSPEATSCWPLAAFPDVAVWPMDVETLVATPIGSTSSAAAQLLEIALREDRWPAPASCPAKERCPHCASARVLRETGPRDALLRILRWYELATGKRWTFRDLNSLFSYLLAGAQVDDAGAAAPCEWAARQMNDATAAGDRTKSRRQLAPFMLVSAQYQHALFGAWAAANVRGMEQCLRDFEKSGTSSLKSFDTIAGLLKFIAGNRGLSVPATLAPQLASLSEVLDPSLADPQDELPFASGTKTLRELDARFSQSVDAGLAYVRRHGCLTPVETDLLERLRVADDELADGEVRRGTPASASRLQYLLRDFACRLVRRSLGVRFALTRDAALLAEFQRVDEGDKGLIHEAARQVEALLNQDDRFEICLNTTFGEPQPPRAHRAVLRTSKQKVKARESSAAGRPPSSVRFLSIGNSRSEHSIPLTYELFRSVRDLKNGLLQSSLPRTVVALLDTTRARLAGRVVRDPETLEDAEIFLGARPEVIARELESFVVRTRGAR